MVQSAGTLDLAPPWARSRCRSVRRRRNDAAQPAGHAISQQREIDPGRVAQRAEMRLPVAVDVDRLNRNLLHRDAARMNDDELLGLEFISVGADVETKLHQASRNALRPV